MAENCKTWSFKSGHFSNKLGDEIKGLLLPMTCRLFLEILKSKGGDLVGFRASPESGGGAAGRGFEPPVGPPPVLRSASKLAQKDRLGKGYTLVESSRIAGVPSPEKMTGAWQARAVLHARPLALGACRRVGARGKSENFGKILEKSGKLFYGGSCHQFLIWPSRCLGFRTDQPRLRKNAVTG